MGKRALIVGIDDYESSRRLDGCVGDAVRISNLLETHWDDEPNFDVKLLTSDKDDVGADSIIKHLEKLFEGNAESVLFYFAGHGYVDEKRTKGFLETPEGSAASPGVDLNDIMEFANKAYPAITSSIIILDCCQSGILASGSASRGLSTNVSVIGDGVTVLTACRSDQETTELDGQGTFTNLLLDGLEGTASDVLGRITPAALYAYVDQSLGEWAARPVYKANVENFITVRLVQPKIPKKILRKLPEYFPTPTHEFKLDPSYEENRGEETERLKDIPVSEEKFKVFRELQNLNNQGLLRPTKHDHMWHSAVFSGGCKLTATGAHYRYLAQTGKI